MLCSPVNWRIVCKLWGGKQKLSCLMINVVVIFVLFMCWELHIIWVVVFSANPSTYIELPTFYASEWLSTFNFVICFFFIWWGERNCSTVVVQNSMAFNTVLIKNMMWHLYFRCSQHEQSTLLSVIRLGSLPQVFRVVKKQCGLGNSIAEEYTTCIIRWLSEDGGSMFLWNSCHARWFWCLHGRIQFQCFLD